MLKIAVAGVGGISGAHIPAWKNMDDVELTALCDIRSEQMNQYDNVNKYTDIDEMLANEKIDILDICLPTYLHADVAIKAMNMGINVISEKPVSLKKEDVKRVYDAAEKNNVKFMIAQVLRFWPEYEFVKEVFDSGKYGKLLSGSMTRLGCYPAWSWDGWMMDEERSGMVPFDLHIHDLDFMVYAFGKPNNTVVHRSKRPEQDYINAVYEFDGFFITSEASWYASPYPFTAQFRFQFENAVIANENGGLKVYERGGDTISFDEAKKKIDTGNANVPSSDAYAAEIRYFTDCVKSDKKPDKVDPASLETVIDILKSL